MDSKGKIQCRSKKVRKSSRKFATVIKTKKDLNNWYQNIQKMLMEKDNVLDSETDEKV